MSDEGAPPSVDELVEYCHTQARLLAGSAETLGTETDDLLDEIDEDIAELRRRLTAHASAARATAATPPTAGPDGADRDIAELEELEAGLEEKQSIARAKRVRMTAVQDLSEAYAELAGELDAAGDGARETLERVVGFERDHDAPAYFDDRQTILEAARDAE